MSKCIIFYYSKHHNCTEKLVQGIKSKYPDLMLADITAAPRVQLAEYDIVGLASGVYFGKPAAQISDFIKQHHDVLMQKKLFTMMTCGSPNERQVETFNSILKEYGIISSGSFQCKGFDTYGPFKLVGGLNKGKPDETDINNAIRFYEKIMA